MNVMHQWNILFQRWRKLGITSKFTIAFGLLLTLILLVAITNYVSLTIVQRETEKAILTSTDIQRMVLEMDRKLEEARCLQRDFFLRYPHIGLTKARQTYALPTVQEIARVITLSDELKRRIAESEVSATLQERRVDLNLYLSAAERFAETFLEAVELVSQLAAVDTGLEPQLAQHANVLREEIHTSEEPTLMAFYRDMRVAEKEYLITRQRPFMQSALNIALRLQWAIEATDALEADQKEQALVYLDNYRTLANKIPDIDMKIRSKHTDFDLQAESVDPISIELIASAEQEVGRARAQIQQTRHLATGLLAIITLLGLALAMIVANVLNKSITRNVLKLTETARELQAGNLDAQAQIDSVDELGQLADTFNAMAAEIKAEMAEMTALNQTLQASERKFRKLFEDSHDTIAITTPDGQLVDINEAGVHLFGYSRVELMQRNVQTLYVNPEDCEKFRQRLEQDGVFGNFETQLRRADGTVIDVLLNATVQRVEDRAVSGFQTIIHDITDRKRAEEALRKSEERYRQSVENSPNPIFSVDREGIIQTWNQACEQLFQYRSEEIIGQTYHKLLWNSGDYSAVEALLAQVWCGYSLSDQDMAYRSNDGTQRLTVSRLYPLRDSDGIIQGCVFANTDITERKLAEEAMRASEEKLRKILEASPDAITVTDLNGNIIECNTATLLTHGFSSKEEVVGTKAFNLIAPKDQVRAAKNMKKTLEQGFIRNIEYTLLNKDGCEFPGELSASVILDSDGNPMSFVGITKDITERKQAEEALREREARLQSIFRAAPTGIGLVSNRILLQVNVRICEMLGYSSDELIGKSARVLYPTDEDFEYVGREKYAQIREHGTGTVETGWKRKDGEVINVLLSSTPIDPADLSVGVTFTALDITEHKRAEKKLKQYHDQLEELVEERTAELQKEITERKRMAEELENAKETAEAANRAKSRFLANMSHELRTPLNAILGFTQLMGRDPTFPEKHKENLGIVSRSGEHLLELINDVLELSKIEAGQHTLVNTSFDLHYTLDSLEEMIRLRAEKKGLQLIFDRDPNVPQYIKTDEHKLRQILINLLGNAVKFTEEGSVTLRIEDCRLNIEDLENEENNRQSSIVNLQFSIEDTGPGIAQEEMDSLFDAFIQTESGRKTQEGTGLGLAISRQFIQLMGGDIGVSSQVGQGTIFTVDIPIELAEAAKIKSRQPARRVIGLEPDQPIYRILVVDDNVESRMLLRAFLEEVGFTVQEAANGQQAIELHERWQPHLIWMDMRMPVMDGYEATRRIRKEEQKLRRAEEQKAVTSDQHPASGIRHLASSTQHPASSHTPIIALTSSAFEENRAAVLTAGCDNFVRKPFHEADIFDLMHKHLGIRYVYEKSQKSKVKRQKSQVENVLTLKALATLPPDLLVNLKRAIARLDVEMIHQVIEEIRSHNAPLADALTALVDDFEYDKILRFIQKGEHQ